MAKHGAFAGEKLLFVAFKREAVTLDSSGQEKGTEGRVGSALMERVDVLDELIPSGVIWKGLLRK